MLISINFFFSSLHLKTRIAFCVCVCGIGHTARNYLRLMREKQQDCLFVFALVVGVCESILGNYNISYVRVIFFLCFCVFFFFGILVFCERWRFIITAGEHLQMLAGQTSGGTASSAQSLLLILVLDG
jgi:phage shock protein PspC (stress-responsive transcriptional regulator)